MAEGRPKRFIVWLLVNYLSPLIATILYVNSYLPIPLWALLVIYIVAIFSIVMWFRQFISYLSL